MIVLEARHKSLLRFFFPLLFILPAYCHVNLIVSVLSKAQMFDYITDG